MGSLKKKWWRKQRDECPKWKRDYRWHAATARARAREMKRDEAKRWRRGDRDKKLQNCLPRNRKTADSREQVRVGGRERLAGEDLIYSVQVDVDFRRRSCS